MKIAHIASGDLWAGAEVATYHLLSALAERADLTVSAVVLNSGELANRLRARGIAVALTSEAGNSFVALRRNVQAHLTGADLVHAHRYKENLLAALSGHPWVTTRHGQLEPRAAGQGHRVR